MNMSETIRTFQGKLLLNTKTGSMRIVKRKSVKLTPHEVMMNLRISVESPEPNVPTIEAKIHIPEKQFHHIVLDDI